MTERSNYHAFVCSDGRTISLCGRKRQLLEMLITGRIAGKGVNKNGLNWRSEDAAMKLLRDDGVLIGKRLTHRDDEHTVSGKGGVCNYHLLDDWKPFGEEMMRCEDIEDQRRPDILPAAMDAFAPFLKSGSIKHEREIELLYPAQTLPKGQKIIRRRAREDAELMAAVVAAMNEKGDAA